MKILFVASEVTPFAKTGGLADVAGALPKTLKAHGHDVRIMMPFYSTVEKGGMAVRKGRKSASVVVGDTERKGFLRQASLGEIPVYLIENKEYFSREHLYGTADGDYPDNHLRFSFFCRCVLELLKKMDFRPDIIHCHDWQTALIPHLLRHERKDDPFFARTGVVFTIHNLAYQGLFPPETLTDMGLAPECFTMDGLEFYGKVNLMKAGIISADVVTTVSEAYCREIQTPEMGCGLHGVLQQRSEDLFGILNGVDYEEWNPAVDREIMKNYSHASLSGKMVDKVGLQRLMGLSTSPDVPLIGMVSRVVAQKGFDLVTELLPTFAAAPLQLVILGSGEERYVKALTSIKARNIAFASGFDNALAPKIYAGSDMFLMPSYFEPCGLGQLIAMRYGSVPVVRRTGGLADSVVDPRDGDKAAPNGFVFDEYTADALWATISRAMAAYEDRVLWKKLMRRGMSCDFSWNNSVNRYLELYRKTLARRGGEG
ncbi:glycogen synthase GlgA [Geomesophilobacter sediminis]|uniref:Glycogen synthase n=1 Tax=Geomesophilobacter sediminis TaxID=2798584 RepID=A0A8J7M1Q5_9BACT|nr:glycogen synthase GlgA [Geomesophilobacter sediminis]MBJ6727073.1 glycogen synthase GlgA [Geomesophilobacter sediminis]